MNPDRGLRQPARRRLVGGLLVLGWFGLASGCATGTAYVDRSAVTVRPWELPGSELSTRRIFRARVQAPEGSGRLRLAMHLESANRYRIDATHPLVFHKRLWSLEVVGDSATLVDHVQEAVCNYRGETEIAAVPVGPFSFSSLAALLLGYLPGTPKRPPAANAEEFVDAEGRRWEMTMAENRLQAWSVWRRSEELATWRLEAPWALLEAPREGTLLRWRETARETASGPPPPLEVPGAYDRLESCDLGWLRAVEE